MQQNVSEGISTVTLTDKKSHLLRHLLTAGTINLPITCNYGENTHKLTSQRSTQANLFAS